MERVQYQLERSIPQLQLLDKHNVFPSEQLRSITTQRQTYESRLLRRGQDMQDYLLYADFEQNLASLINIKAERLGLPRAFHHANSASHTGHIISIYERLVRKFKYSVDAWLAYIKYAKGKKMRVVTGRVYARALALHSNHVPLWLAAASYELNDNSSTTAARSLLQRALRLNELPWKTDNGPTAKRRKQDTGSAEIHTEAKSGPARLHMSHRESDLLRLWVQYIRMELVFIERLRRRWLVLGLQWDSEPHETENQSNSIESSEVTQAATDLEARVQSRDSDSEDNEETVLLSQVPEAEHDPHQIPSSTSKAGVRTPREMNHIPPAQLAILRGNIPLFLISSGLQSLAPPLHFVFLVSLTVLFRQFPFAEPADASAKRNGEAIRDRLLNGVYTIMRDQERWTWDHLAPTALFASTELFRDSWDFQSDNERKQIQIDNQQEMDSHSRLLEASQLRTDFCEDTDGVLDLVAGLESDKVAQPLGVRLVLQLFHVLLCMRNGNESQATSLCQRLGSAGVLPTLIRDILAYLRSLCNQAPAQGLTFKSSPKSELFTATSLLVEMLMTPSRSDIDEPNLLAYLESTKSQLIREARAAGPGIETAQMRAIPLRQKMEAAFSSDKQSKKLNKLLLELIEATSKSNFPTSGEIWLLRIRAKIQLYGQADPDHIVAEWKLGLTACAESVDVESMSSNKNLWTYYCDWLDSSMSLSSALKEGRDHRKPRSYSEKFEALYRWAVKETSSLLSRIGTGSHTQELHEYRHRTHDIVVERYFDAALQYGKESDTIHWLLRSCFASEIAWLAIVQKLKGSEIEDKQRQSQFAVMIDKILAKLVQSADKTSDTNLWLIYLEHRAQGDMPRALTELQRCLRTLPESEHSKIESGWQKICDELKQL